MSNPYTCYLYLTGFHLPIIIEFRAGSDAQAGAILADNVRVLGSVFQSLLHRVEIVNNYDVVEVESLSHLLET